MKNILLLLSILLSQPMLCRAQRLGDFLTHLVTPLDKTEITSGFLWDKGLNGFAEPAIFDGTLRDSAYLQPATFGFLYVQARNAYTGTGTNPLPHPDTYMDYVNRYNGTDTIPLAALALRYHRIHKNALDSNLLSLQDEQLFDVPGRTQSPYWQDTMLAFAPLKSDAWHTTVHFTLPTDLVWQNMGWSNPLLQADFDNGQGWQTLIPGETYTIDYDSGGVKTILTSIQQGSVTLKGQSVLFVAEQAVQERGSGPNYPVEVPEDIISIPGGGGDLRIFYGSPCNKLLKPFILVEGFELVDNPMQFTDRLNNLLVEKVNVITSDPDLPLGEWLYAQGYDIVWVNLTNVQGYIQDNAAVVKAAVQKVNEIKAANGSSEPNMIMGVSAGGVITKYMLAKTNSVPFDHQCEKFFSYDAPLRGANLPVSVQCLLHHANYIASSQGQDLLSGNPAVAVAFNALTGPFARQMLLYRFYYPPNPNDSDDGRLDSGEHDAFMAEMDALGSIPIRHIALSNGSPDNTTRANISPGSQMFNVNTSGNGYGISFPITIPAFVKVEFEANGYALPNNVNGTIYDGNLKIKINLIVFKQFPLDVEVPQANRSYDTAPGGSSTVAIIAIKALDGTPVPSISVPTPFSGNVLVGMSPIKVTSYATHNCFIPTRSSISAGDGIDINGTFNCGQGTSNRCTMNSASTALPTEYGVSMPEINQDHVFLDARIGDVIVDEVDGANLIPGGLLPSTLSTYYNAGLHIQSGIPTMTISTAGGKLSINNTGKVAYATSNEPVSPFNLLNAYTKCNAVITVEQGARIVVGADGSAKHGVLNVLGNSIVHIKSGGILHVTSNQSKLWIKSGARLILDPGAIVHLESPESSIRIEGDLVLNGDIDFQGYGYFDFGNGNALEFGSGVQNFNLSGRGIGNRFVRLSNYLNIEAGHGVNWSNGKMEALYGSLLINSGGSCRFNRMEVASSGPADDVRAIVADAAQLMTFDYCDFNQVGTVVTSQNSGLHRFYHCNFSDIKYGAVTEGGSGFFLVTNCDFEQYSHTAVALSDRPSLTVTNSNWDGEPGATGLDLFRVATVTLRNSHLDNHSGIFDPQTGSFIHAVNLDGVPYFIMRNSGMSDNSVGINSLGVFSEEPSNIFLLEGSFIQNSEAGIYSIGDATRGLVLMDCSSLLNNEFGVYGRDVILMIDAINAQQHPLDGNEPNTFLRSGWGANSDQYFEICYAQKSPVQPIPMRKNWWAVNDINTRQLNPQTFMSIFHNSCGTPSTVDVSQALDRAPLDCNPDEFAGASFTGAGTEAECNTVVGGEFTVLGEAWHTAYQHLRSEDFEAAEAGFQPIADLWSADLSSYSPNCQLYIQVAKAIVDGAGQSGAQRHDDGASEGAKKQPLVAVNPNPSHGFVNISLPDEPCNLRVWDSYGKLMHQTAAAGVYRLEVAEWPSGFYWVEVLVNGNGLRESRKMVVQRH